jgi:hypothetical protein
MSRTNSIEVPLEGPLFDALIVAAKRDYRHPREQARYLLRSALLGDRAGPEPPETKKHNGAANFAEASGAVAG